MTTSARERVGQALAADIDAIVQGILEVIVSEIPAYRTLDKTQLAEVGAIARWGTGRVIELWVVGGSLSDDDVRRFQGIGAARAMEGRPLPAVLRAYRVAAAYVIRTLVERFEDDLSVADVAAASNLWLETMDLLSEAIYGGYERSINRIGGGGGDLAFSDLLHDLLLGRHSSLAALSDRSRNLNITFPEHPQLVVARPEQANDNIPTLGDVKSLSDALGLATGLSDVPDSVFRSLHAVRDRLGVILTQGLDVGSLEVQLADMHWVACVIEQQPITDVSKAYRLASTCLNTAPAYAWVNRRVLADGDANALAMLTAGADVDGATVKSSILGELLQPGQEHLLEGLDALLAAGGATGAAAALGLHSQTMRYRARRIKALTGRDPRLPWDRFVLQVARIAGGTSAY